jgi:hypothetical protein
VVPSHLIRLGAQALADMTANVARGEPLVRCQLLASQFNEALKRELLATSELGPIEQYGGCGGQPLPPRRKCKH